MKCARCGKTVYFAEKQSYDGKDFHGICLNAHKKETKVKQMGYYPGDEKRIAGELKGVKPNVSPSTASPAPGIGQSASGGGGGASFCSNCGTKAAGGKFCSSCGNAL